MLSNEDSREACNNKKKKWQPRASSMYAQAISISEPIKVGQNPFANTIFPD